MNTKPFIKPNTNPRILSTTFIIGSDVIADTNDLMIFISMNEPIKRIKNDTRVMNIEVSPGVKSSAIVIFADEPNNDEAESANILARKSGNLIHNESYNIS